MSSDSNASNSFDLNFFKDLERSSGDHGYLICYRCYGYYPLKENELPEDFLECECGNDLVFYENIDDFMHIKGLEDLDKNSEILDDNYNEIENVLKSKSEKRKEFFRDLSTRIKMQEDILAEINYGESGLWDALEGKSLESGATEQNAAANIGVMENNFLSHVKKQRSRVERAENHYFTKIGAVLFVIAVFMLLVVYLWA